MTIERRRDNVDGQGGQHSYVLNWSSICGGHALGARQPCRSVAVRGTARRIKSPLKYVTGLARELLSSLTSDAASDFTWG